MAWTVEISETAKRELRKLDRQTARKILDYIDTRIAPSEDPRLIGKALTGPLRQYWRYRVGDYRLICDLQDRRMVVLVLDIGNRRDVYR